MPLRGGRAQVRCGFCGGTFVLERRLREAEPDVPPERRRVTAEWTPAHISGGTAVEKASCWGCGNLLDFSSDQAIVTCSCCGSESKIERRTRRLDPEIPIAEGEDPKTAALVDGIRRSTDLAQRVTLAEELTQWVRINRTLARRAPQIMEVMQTCDFRLAHVLGDVIGKLLCQGDVLLRDSVACAAPDFVCDLSGSRALLWHLGLGSGVCLKPLLDAADILWQHGAAELAGMAMWAANILLGRNYSEHTVLGKIILYRMIYLDGPVLGWALNFAHNKSLGYSYPTATLLRFIDDCAAERPALVPAVREAIYDPPLTDERDYRARLDLFATLRTVEARETLLRTLPAPPQGTSLRLLTATLDLLVGLLDDQSLSDASTTALAKIMDQGVPGRLHQLVKEKGDSLPDEFRRAYLKHVPDSEYLTSPPPTTNRPWEKQSLGAEIEKAREQYSEFLKRAVDSWDREKEAVKRYSEIIRDRTPLMEAAGRGDVNQVKLSLAGGADINDKNGYGRTALMFAAESGHQAVVDELVKGGAKVADHDREGLTALMIAAEGGHASVVSQLLGEADDDHRQDAYHKALAARRFAIIKLLLEAGADPDMLDEQRRTPLMAAARDGDCELARTLMAGGAMLDHQDNQGLTALDHATQAGQKGMVNLLTD